MSRLKAVDPEETKQGKTKAMIFSASGVGKTWFALTFPAPYYIDTEGGADLEHYKKRLKASGGGYMGVEHGSLDFETVIDQMRGLATEKHHYKTLVIDSITKLYQTTIAAEAERLGEKDNFGASKKPAIAKMRSLVNWAMRLDMNILFIAHEMTEWGIVNGQRQEIGKLADVWDKLIYELDLTLQAVKRGSSRVAIVRKSRLTGFQDMDSFDLSYEEFAKRYGKDFIEAETKQLELCSKEQVEEINRLLSLLQLSQEDTDKALKKAQCDKVEELTVDQAKDFIARLTKKITGKAA